MFLGGESDRACLSGGVAQMFCGVRVSATFSYLW